MRIGTTGIVTNEYNEILLIKRDDTETWAAPGGGVEQGESPAEACAREVREETDLYVMPVRLAYLTFYPKPGANHLQFVFRCLMRGGEVMPGREVLDARFFRAEALPKPMRELDLDRIEKSKYHAGPVRWVTRPLSMGDRLRAMLGGRPEKSPFEVDVRLFIRDEGGRVVVNRDGVLPGGPVEPYKSPWAMAEKHGIAQLNRPIELKGLHLVQTDRKSDKLKLVFSAESLLNNLKTVDPAELPDLEADWVAGIIESPEETRFV